MAVRNNLIFSIALPLIQVTTPNHALEVITKIALLVEFDT